MRVSSSTVAPVGFDGQALDSKERLEIENKFELFFIEPVTPRLVGKPPGNLAEIDLLHLPGNRESVLRQCVANPEPVARRVFPIPPGIKAHFISCKHVHCGQHYDQGDQFLDHCFMLLMTGS